MRGSGRCIRLDVYGVCERTITQLPDMAEVENIRNPVANSLNINDRIEVTREVWVMSGGWTVFYEPMIRFSKTVKVFIFPMNVAPSA